MFSPDFKPIFNVKVQSGKQHKIISSSFIPFLLKYMDLKNEDLFTLVILVRTQ